MQLHANTASNLKPNNYFKAIPSTVISNGTNIRLLKYTTVYCLAQQRDRKVKAVFGSAVDHDQAALVTRQNEQAIEDCTAS